MNRLLKLDFNERSDNDCRLSRDYAFNEPLWQYPDRSPLEQQIANNNGLDVSQVLCTNGGDEAIMILMRVIQESARLVLPLPAFSQYLWGVESWQLEAELIAPVNGLSIDIVRILKSIERQPPSITIITRPNNPTGELISLCSLTDILDAAKKNNSWVFLDEAYIEFSECLNTDYSQSTNSNNLLAKYDNLIILRTLSKAYGLAAIRLGYLLGSKKLIEQFRQRCMPFNISQPTIEIASRALSGNNRQEVNDYVIQIRKNREEITSWLETNKISVIPSQANFLLLSLPEQQAQAIQSFLKKNQILVRCFSDSSLKNCLRITIPFDIDRLMSLLQQSLTPKLICLDMDGVLIDTTNSYDLTIRETVKQLSGSTIEIREIEQLKASGGYNNDWVVTQKLLEDRGITIPFDMIVERFQDLYSGNNNDGFVANEIPLINPSLISRINAIKQSIFAVVTGRPTEEALNGCQLVQLSTTNIISLDDVDKPKPSPEGIIKLQQRFSSSSWMCGDNPDDMAAAKQSNCVAIGIGNKNAASLYRAGADIVLNSINDLEEWLCPLK